MRDYSGLPGQWGSEATPAAFLANLLALANETRRVLAPHGSLVFELGDTYSGSGGSGGDYGANGMRASQRGFTGSARRDRSAQPRQWSGGSGWPLPKSLCLIPTLFPACLAYGRNLLDPTAEPFEPWRVRNLIVWARNNPPVGALGDKVRPATSYITVACTSGRRWFDLDAVRGPVVAGKIATRAGTKLEDDGGRRATMATYRSEMSAGTPPLDHWWDEPDGDLVWLINTQGSSLAHYAMWPPKLAERLVLSMVPAEVCRVCGEPRRRLVEQTEAYAEFRRQMNNGDHDLGHYGHGSGHGAGFTTGTAGRDPNGVAIGSPGAVHRSGEKYRTVGWSDCGHGSFRPGVCLDPFAGTGTTLAVADIHGRDAIGFDLDPGNQRLYPIRHAQVWRALGRTAAPPVTEHGQQASLFG